MHCVLLNTAVWGGSYGKKPRVQGAWLSGEPVQSPDFICAQESDCGAALGMRCCCGSGNFVFCEQKNRAADISAAVGSRAGVGGIF